ncbi:hypothetical protein G6F59_013034 [Rhizopus arrhizus]|nr:hypothetical protein G6F59_013034 [Rhizopus arrhizus]
MLLAEIFVAGHHVAFHVRVERGAHAHFGGVAVEVQAALFVVLLVRNARHQVGVRCDAVVVADTQTPLVDVVLELVGLLRAVVAEDVEVRVHRNGTLHLPAIGVAALGIGVHIAAFNVVVRQAVGCRCSERQSSQKTQGKQRILVHRDTPLIILVSSTASREGEREEAIDRCELSVRGSNRP